MKINISQAIKQFFNNPSLDLVYFEAIANSLDANATQINLDIKINSFDDPKSLQISVIDNGDGFSKRGYERFCKLLEADNANNKGLGRLVFLHYFRSGIYDTYSKDFKKQFTLDKNFDGDFKSTSLLNDYGNTLTLKGYQLDKILTYKYVRAKSLAKSIQMHFLPRLFLLNQSSIKTEITINVETDTENTEKDFYSDTQVVSTEKLPTLKSKVFEVPLLDLISGSFELLYMVKRDYENHNLTVALTADNRTIDISDIIAKDNIPEGYDCIFLIQSEFFQGKVSNSRQKLDIEDSEFKAIKYEIINQIKIILETEIPSIVEKNEKQKEYLDKKYPHLSGYFNENIAGLIDRNKLVEKAQSQFFKEQKKLLEAESLSDKAFEKSLEVSSRVLTEYILYRNLIIQKLKETNHQNNEADVHELIIPMQESFRSDSHYENIYRNNAWLLDDKFMTYTTILSDQSLQKLLNEIKIEEELQVDKNTRPDISIVFNGNPDTQKVDVVIVELKPRQEKLHENEKVIGQIKRRARRLLEYYPTKIQRLWFYAIVDIDEEFGRSLKSDGYQELFSTGKTYFKSQNIFYADKNNIEHECPIDVSVLTYDSMLDDAKCRNDTFLNILRESIKQQYSN